MTTGSPRWQRADTTTTDLGGLPIWISTTERSSIGGDVITCQIAPDTLEEPGTAALDPNGCGHLNLSRRAIRRDHDVPHLSWADEPVLFPRYPFDLLIRRQSIDIGGECTVPGLESGQALLGIDHLDLTAEVLLDR